MIGELFFKKYFYPIIGTNIFHRKWPFYPQQNLPGQLNIDNLKLFDREEEGGKLKKRGNEGFQTPSFSFENISRGCLVLPPPNYIYLSQLSM